MNPQTLPAGPELDQLVADAFPRIAPAPHWLRASTVISDAFLVLDILRKRGWGAMIQIGESGRAWVILKRRGEEHAYTVGCDTGCAQATALAICRAALLAVEKEKQNAG